MAFPKFSEYKARELEQAVLDYWEDNGIPDGLAERRQGKKKFFLLDGPPYINALPHVGHVLTTVCKDVWTRWKYMRGFDCLIQPGFDCHGLPVEVMVEKDLGIKSKQEILEMGIEKFDAACFQKILNNEKAWTHYYLNLGAWRAFFEPYFTHEPYYIESVWWAFKQWWEDGLVSEGERSIHWCSHCETALAGYEVSDSYAMRSDPGVYVKFKVTGRENEFLLVYTTTPWTLPSNTAIAVAGGEEYVKAAVGNEVLVVGKKLAEKVLREMAGYDYVVEKELKGADLEGLEYEPAIECGVQRKLAGDSRTRRVYLSIPLMTRKKYRKHESGEEPQEEVEEFVTLAEGTGLVHAAPGHGLTDYLFGKHYGLPAASPVDQQGRFTAEVEQWAGEEVKKADKKIIEYLREKDSLFHETQVQNSYPLCWRCKTPLLFRLSPQIYLSIAPLKEKMLESNRGTHWMPAYGEEAFGNWVAQAADWCISQQRFWGIPIPLWKCSACNARKVVGSVAELRENAAEEVGKLEDLHRHVVDAVKLKCGECGAVMRRVPDIFNVWVDSGCAWAASLGYPFANKELFEQVFPVDVVCESQDQIRGWFYSLFFTSFATLGKPAFRECAMMGWVVDEKGEKMSKSLGNVVDAGEAIEKAGADALRAYFCSNIAPWELHRFSFQQALEVQRSLNIFFNALKFYEMYAVEGIGTGGEVTPQTPGLRLEDKWILSKLDTVSGRINDAVKEFGFHAAGRALLEFVVNDFSRWYVKLGRDRVAVEAEDAEDKRVCLTVLKHVLLESAKLFAPFTPFLSEYVFQSLAGGEHAESVHYADYPTGGKGFANPDLEAAMARAMAVCEACNSLRQAAGVKLRWPLAEMQIEGGAWLKAVEGLKELLETQNNVLSVKFVDKIADETSEEKWKKKEVDFGGGKLVVALDTERTVELRQRALLRELVRAVQQTRKKNGLVVTQRIALSVWASNEGDAAFFNASREALAPQVGASSVAVVEEERGLAGEYDAAAQLQENSVKAKYSVVS